MHSTHTTQYQKIQTTRCDRISNLVLAACLVSAAASAQGHTFCADSAAAIHAALTAASDGGANANENNTIQIVRGTYNVSNAEFYYFNQSTARKLDINGGYNSDCSAAIENPELTVLDGGGVTPVFESESDGDVSVRYLTFQNGSIGTNDNGAGGVTMNYIGTAHGPVIFDQNIVRNNHADDGNGGLFIAVNSSATLQLENNLIVGNTAGGNYAAGEVLDDGGGANITNNTFSQNTVAQMPATNVGGLRSYFSSTASPPPDTLSNNIFWGNSGDDLDTAAVLVNNDFTSDRKPIDSSSSGNISVDPKFSSSTDFHLAPTSPLLGLGTLTPTGGLPTIDIEGHPRSYNGHVDVGAYERGDAIFADRFED